MGVNQTNRALCLTLYSLPQVLLISCQNLSNAWALVNCSTNMCQSDICFLYCAKITRVRPPTPWTFLSLLHRQPGGHLSKHIHSQGWRSRWYPSICCCWLHHPNMKTFQLYPSNVRSINRLDPLDLHHLAYQMDKYLFPVKAIEQQIWGKETHILSPAILFPLLALLQIGGKPTAHA